jgi:RNA polymerase sigma-70 factor (ECF subfamily)
VSADRAGVRVSTRSGGLRPNPAPLPDVMMADEVEIGDERTQLDSVLEHFARYQRRLYLYILGLVVSPADAEEVLQETNIVVWKKCDQFQSGTDFRAWVFRIALFEARKLHDRRRKQGLNLSDELLEQLATTYEQQEDGFETRRERLAACIEKLRPDDKRLVTEVYGGGLDVPLLAERSGREKTSIYRSLRRIRRILFDCVEIVSQGEAAI